MPVKGQLNVVAPFIPRYKHSVSNKVPEDFCDEHGWCKKNNYGLEKGEAGEGLTYLQLRFKRAGSVARAWRKTPEARKNAAIIAKESWEARVAKAKTSSDTTEVYLLEELTKPQYGSNTTAEVIAKCIGTIARELSKRGIQHVEDLELKDLVLISNTLIGLTKAAAATKKDQDWKPNVQVNNVTVNNNSKTGGAVGGILDIEPLDKLTGDGQN